MTFSKTHSDFVAVLSDLTQQALDLMSIFPEFIDQNNEIHCHEYVGKKRVTFAAALIDLTQSNKVRISKLLKELKEAGIIDESGRFHAKFSDSLILKTNKKFSKPNYKLPSDKAEMMQRASLFFQTPRLHTGDTSMNPALKNEFNELKTRFDKQTSQLNDLQSLILQVLNKFDAPTEVKEEVKRHLELVKP